MTIYALPDVYANEVSTTEGPVLPAQLGIGLLQAVTQKGPIGVPVRTRNFSAWKKVFGEREAVARGDAAYEAEQFFAEGGFELITVRQAHFADLTDKTSFTGLPSSRTILTDGVAATAASKQLAVGPYNLEPGDSFDIQVDNDAGGATTPTFNAAAGYVDDTSTWPLASSQVGKTVIINGQTVEFVGTAQTLTDAMDEMNTQLTGLQVFDNGSGQIRVRNDIRGTSGTVSAPSGTSDITWAAPTAPTGNVANIDLVTTAEVQTIVEGATTPAVTVTLNGDGSCTVTSPTTGTASELDFQSALTPLGISVEVINGTAAGATYSTLKFWAGYLGNKSPGEYGNVLKTLVTQTPKYESQGAGSDLNSDYTAGEMTIDVTSLNGIESGSVLKIWDGTNTEYPVVDTVATSVVGGSVTFTITLVAAMTNSYTAAATQMQTQEFSVEVYNGNVSVETHEDMSLLDTADNYYVTLMNDEATGSEYLFAEDLTPAIDVGARLPAEDSAATLLSGGTDETVGLVDADWIGESTGGTGLYAWDNIHEFAPLATPGNNGAALAHAAAEYCRSRIFYDYVTYCDEGMTSTECIAFRNTVLGLNSSYVFLYAGGEKVYDPNGSGSNPQRSISGVGAIMGLMGRVDTLPSPNGGPWNAPAGEGDYGTLRNARDVATEYTDTDHGNMNLAGINVIRKFGPTSPVYVWGQRTQYTGADKKWVDIPVRRFFQFVEKSIIDSTRWTVFRNNDFRLWDKIKDRVEAFLRDLMDDRAFPTTDAAAAFSVLCGITDGTMTQTDVDNHKTKATVALAPQKPNEFTIFEFSQKEGVAEVTEL